jgi:two-component system LytT family response regulator
MHAAASLDRDLSSPVTHRVLIVDDEPLARRGLRACLQRSKDFAVSAECGSGEEALHAIRTLKPDLVFLDIEMPGIGGFEVVERLRGGLAPLVIFTTAYARYAVEAFDVAATDYLLKPIDPDRLSRALSRAREALAPRGAGPERTAAAAPAREAPPLLERFWVHTRGSIELVPVDDVDWIQAEGDYVRLHVRERSYLVSESLSSLEEQLPPSTFLRIHRCAIVNLRRVTEVRRRSNMDCEVRLSTGAAVRLSRTYYSRFVETIRPSCVSRKQ